MDFGFTKIFTPGIVKFTYFMSVPGLLLAWAVLTGVGFHYGTWWGLGALVVARQALVVARRAVQRRRRRQGWRWRSSDWRADACRSSDGTTAQNVTGCIELAGHGARDHSRAVTFRLRGPSMH